jgi:hypothetical protein
MLKSATRLVLVRLHDGSPGSLRLPKVSGEFHFGTVANGALVDSGLRQS